MPLYFEKNVDISRIRNFKNYSIINTNNNKRNCYIFCNGALRVPSQYTQSFVDGIDDKFEFGNIFKNKKIQRNGSKFIFLRDVCSIFYLYGLNEEICSIDDMVDFLKKETAGYKIILCGFSAGAYLATLLSTKLNNVIRTLTFGTVFNLLHWDGALHNYDQSDVDFFVKNTNPLQSKYLNLIPLLDTSDNKIYYFYGYYNVADKKQCSFIKESLKNIVKLPIKTNQHCGNLKGVVLVELLSCSERKLNRVLKDNKVHSANFYLFKFVSIFKITDLFLKKFFKIKKRK